MIDLLFQIALSNVGISLALAIVAVVVGIFFKRPALAHLLWLLVIVKLLTPSLVTIPVATISAQADPNLEDAYVYFMQTLGVKEPQEEENWSSNNLEGIDHD